MSKLTLFLLGILMPFSQVFSQGTVSIEGYVYEENNRGFIGAADVYLYTNQMIRVAEAVTDEYGHFVFKTTNDRQYIVRAKKKLYFQKELNVNPADANEANKIFLKMELEREPGYIFDVTLAEPRPAPDAPANSVDGATIEIYNNTKKKMEWVSEDHPSPYFKFTFQQGNHYTIMISKKEYITKQIEAYVNVHGCIVCIDGVDDVKPGVVDNLTSGHQKGTLLANIELRPIKIGAKIPIDNLYYGSGSYSVKKSMHKSLDELVVLLENNPSLLVELRSHTDCQGDATFNKNLSMKRATEAVKYLLKHSEIKKYRLKAVGMGESKPVTKCKCANCTDRQLARNRRTELVVTGLLNDQFVKLPLTKKKEEEIMEMLLMEVMNSEQIQIPEGGELPDDLKKQEKNDVNTDEKLAQDSPKKPAIDSNVTSSTSDEDSRNGKKTKAQMPNTNIESKPAVTQTPVTKKPTDRGQQKTKQQKLAEAQKRAEEALKRLEKDRLKEIELAEAQKRAEEAFEGKAVVGKDPDVQDVVEGAESTYDIVEEVSDSVPESAGMIVTEVDLGSMDISKVIPVIEKNFSGYRIEIKRSRFELPSSDAIFSMYSDIAYVKSSNGDYIYTTGDFATRTIANVGMDYVRKDFPKAKLHLFRKGKMVD